MYETRDMTNIPVIVVANKIDLVAAKNYVPPPVQPPRPHHHHHHQHHHHHHPAAPAESANHLSVAGCSNILALSPLISLNGALTNGSGGSHSHQPHPPEVGQIRDRKEISHMVRKTWRSSHIECSAKFNWNVMAIFRELAVTLNMIANGQTIGGSSSSRKRRCLMFWWFEDLKIWWISNDLIF